MPLILFIAFILFYIPALACSIKDPEGRSRNDTSAVQLEVRKNKKWDGYTIERVEDYEVLLHKGNEWVSIPFSSYGPGDCSVIVKLYQPRPALMSLSLLDISPGPGIVKQQKALSGETTEKFFNNFLTWSTTKTSPGFREIFPKVNSDYIKAVEALAEKMPSCQKGSVGRAWVKRAQKILKRGSSDYVFKISELRAGIKAVWARQYNACIEKVAKDALFAEYQFWPYVKEYGELLEKFSATQSGDVQALLKPLIESLKAYSQSRPTPLQQLLNPQLRLQAIAGESKVSPEILKFIQNQTEFKKPFALHSAFDGYDELINH